MTPKFMLLVTMFKSYDVSLVNYTKYFRCLLYFALI